MNKIAITTAVKLLRQSAEGLQESHTTSRDRNDWTGEEDAKAAFDERMAVAAALESMPRQCLHQIAEPAAIHPDDAAVDALAEAMKAKLAKQREKGYGGWDDKTQCPQQRLSDMLRAHVDKGDPVDVANFCAMLSARYEGIAAPTQVDQVGGTQLPVEVPESDTLWLLLTGGYSLNYVRSGLSSGSPHFENEAKVLRQRAQRVWAQIRAQSLPLYAHPAEGVPAPFSASGIAPCPLCGGESKHVKSGEDSGHRILCWNDDCECSSGYFSSKEDAIASWNSRAALAATQPAAQEDKPC